MKYLLYNFELIPENQFQIQVSNRAFQYNDGAFETMLFVNGKVRFLEGHLKRLNLAAKVLYLELPEVLLEEGTIGLWIEKLIAENQIIGTVRLKLKVWRSGNGLYTPEQNSAEVLITAEAQKEYSTVIETTGFANSVRTHYSTFSFFKGPNSQQYVLAGIEKKQRQLDEIILLSSEGFVSECLASNIFWIKNDTVLTPSIEDGCVAGIMRENLLRLFQAKNIPFKVGKFLPEELLAAEIAFTTNAAGIKVVQQIGETKFSKLLPAWLLKLLTENQFI